MDRNFDDLSTSFKQQIYGTLKGQLRLALLALDLQEWMQSARPLSILDTGAGQGQCASLFAQQGHQLVLNDISATMLQQAQLNLTERAPQNATHPLIIAPLQNLHETLQQHGLPLQYDLVLNHAVLEWLDDPETAIKSLLRWVKPSGYLSLMFYNRQAILWRHLMNGSWHRIAQTSFEHHKNPLMPQSPLNPERIQQFITEQGFCVVHYRGIRCVYDHMHASLRQQKSLQDFIEIERDIGVQSPYRELGRYIHFLCRPAH